MPFSIFAHPCLMAAFAAVAVGIVIYEIVSKNQEKVSSGRPPRGPRRPSRGPSSGRDSPFSRDLPPSPKGFKGSIVSTSGNPNSSKGTRNELGYTDSEVRKRNVPKPDLSKETVKNKTRSNKRKELSPDADNLQTENQKLSPNAYHQNVDKNNCGKIVNETKSVNKETKSVQNISKNISDEDSDSENTNNFKICNMDVSDQRVYSLNGSNNLSQTSKEEEIYKRNISENIKCEAMKNEPVSQEKDKNVGQEIVQEKNYLESQEASVSGISFNVTREICSGCEEAPITAVAHPCGHSYLCLDCAKIVFRIHKTCSICLADITKFESM